MFKHKGVHQCTWDRDTLGRRLMIDFVVVSSNLRPYVLDTRVKRGTELSTDHHLVVSLIRWRGRKQDRLGRPKRTVRVCWERLAESPVREIYNSHLRRSFDRIPRESGDIESEWTMFSTSIVDTSVEAKEEAKAEGLGEGALGVWGPGPFAKGCPVPVQPEQELGLHCQQISRRSQGPEGVWFGDHTISSLLFADDVVMLAPSDQNLQHALGRFAAKLVESTCLKWRSSSILGSCSRLREGWNGRLTDGSVQLLKYCGMRSMYRSVVVKKELSCKAKLSIYRSIYVPTLTYGHELWVMTERTRSRIQAADMSFLPRVAGRSLRVG
ncbi:hypothetical protein PO909_029047 [Leuciscus waleckii]